MHYGKWTKWGSCGFTREAMLQLQEDYPNVTMDTYKGVSGYIYAVKALEDVEKLVDIPFVFVTKRRIKIESVEYVPDTYNCIMKSVERGEILLQKYEDLSEAAHQWIRNMMIKEYETASAEYKYFLKQKFKFLSSELR